MLMLICGAAFLVACAGCGSQPKPTIDLPDEEIARRLMGSWRERHALQGVETDARVRFKADGHYTFEGTQKHEGKVTPLSITATWRVTSGVLEYTIVSCEPPLLSKGKVIRDRVLAIDEREFLWQDEEGNELTLTRLAD
jgi:hypothetical protein